MRTLIYRTSSWIVVLVVGLTLNALGQPGAEAELAARYFQDGEWESALELYEKVYRRTPSEAYALQMLACYENLGQFEEGVRFLDRVIRRERGQPIYPILKANLLEKTGDFKEADKLYEQTIDKALQTQGHFVQVGSYLYQEGKYDWALKAYTRGRKVLRMPYVFANEIANIHAQQGEYQLATEEYLNLYYQDPQNLNAANLAILNLVSPAATEAVEKSLLQAIDKRPSDRGLRSLIYEYYVLAEKFYEAFIQVKAIDRLFKEDGRRVFQYAEVMRNNQEYDLSDKAYDYLIDKKKGTQFYFQAHFEKATNAELKAFDQIPVDMLSIQQAVDDYGRLLDEFSRRPEYFEAIYRRAYLMVFYLNDLDVALSELRQLVGFRNQLNPEDWAQAQLLIGDILLIQQYYNKAKLTYTEVSDAFTDRQTGALAKYKLAQLAYYKGEFNLATALLDAIKDNTSNDISNDAIRLNLIILDNTGLDTTTVPLEIFARAQLLTYQRQYDASLALLDSLAFAFPEHALADEILWEKATIFLNQNDVNTALTFIDRILKQFPTDIYGDDALYTKARIYDYTLKDPDKAKALYLEFLMQYPGSLFSVEVRKRIRELRQG